MNLYRVMILEIESTEACSLPKLAWTENVFDFFLIKLFWDKELRCKFLQLNSNAEILNINCQTIL